jgi:hypothetical protein
MAFRKIFRILGVTSELRAAYPGDNLSAGWERLQDGLGIKPLMQSGSLLMRNCDGIKDTSYATAMGISQHSAPRTIAGLTVA